jgi:DNA-binding GntR family transcriptional regulator
MMKTKTSKQSLTDQAYEKIHSMVLDLRLLPGQPVRANELADQLGMSRTPVREAIHRLCIERLVGKDSSGQMVVTIPTVEAMKEVYEIIAGIEGQAARLAAERANEAMIKQLDESVAMQEAAIAEDDFVAWHEADQLFHRLLIEATGNKRMQEVMKQFSAELHRIRLAAMRIRPRWTDQSVRDHRALVEAIRAHDGEAARRIHLEHRERAIPRMETLYSEFMTLMLQVQIAATSASA